MPVSGPTERSLVAAVHPVAPSEPKPLRSSARRPAPPPVRSVSSLYPLTPSRPASTASSVDSDLSETAALGNLIATMATRIASLEQELVQLRGDIQAKEVLLARVEVQRESMVDVPSVEELRSRIAALSEGADESCPVLLIIVFDNGFACRGAVREWTSSEGRAFWRDVRDGYIPETLKADYPDGVRLHVVDHTSSAHLPRTPPLRATPTPSFCVPVRRGIPVSPIKAQPPSVLVPGGGSCADSPMRIKVRSRHGAIVVACHPHDAPGAVIAWLMREGTLDLDDKHGPRPRRLRGPMGAVVDDRVSFQDQGLVGSVVFDLD
ncbi:hypothetical protein AMAG_14737 [Allomyces macrogynus ATCC 38327]|uniref:Uncharacterized protein n=1 Tax=Allomyces macrogynus (strain ATCC 38327) TaxID=578462 RepID=A0A0L0T565_ALLM3|nr:hypothetical protein AMAG_14737 [Allomyces macrogynus ATCC 38327]|eukprot:KNE69890.1 hypothetical protein AMAG_14737 [Allomyces macrogynus ATCC 38327]